MREIVNTEAQEATAMIENLYTGYHCIQYSQKASVCICITAGCDWDSRV